MESKEIEGSNATHEKWQHTENGFGGNYPQEGEHSLFALKPNTRFRYEKRADRKQKARRKENGTFSVDVIAFGYRYTATRIYLPLYWVSVSLADVQMWQPTQAPDYYNGYGRDGEECFLTKWD